MPAFPFKKHVKRRARIGVAFVTLTSLVAWHSSSTEMNKDFGRRIANADAEPQNWLSYGRDYQETRDSPLTAINDHNVGELGLAWYYDLDTNRGQEATPLVVDGVIYSTSAWSKVQAFDGVTGKLLWQFDPQVPGDAAVKTCCDVVNRGVAYWEGKLFLGTIDGRLIAIDGKTGREIWSTMTVDPLSRNTITGAPRVAKGKVFIGNGGAEQGARGFISAYDAETGKRLWRFYTVPGEPGTKDGEISDAPLQDIALKTWAGQWWKQENGLGGGTVWDSIVYDPETNLLFVGVGNASLWNRKLRSAGQGDNLFVSSILALDSDTGKYVWHYQQVPGDEWDYTATQQMTLATFSIGGKPRQVLMQAPKNGFFYVLDRRSGKLLSAKPFATVNWASRIDMNTGRPVIVPEARWSETGKPFFSLPSGSGAHSWHPMAYSRATRLVYIPVQDMGSGWASDAAYKYMPVGANVGVDPMAAKLPDNPGTIKEIRKTIKAYLLAWDPVAQKEVWRAPNPSAPPGGVLSTAGNLVFQGDVEGHISAYDARSGKQLWRYATGTPIVAPPITWARDGVQYVTVVAGWGGSSPLILGPLALDDHGNVRNTTSRVLTFRLGGKAALPKTEVAAHFDAPRPKPFGDEAMVRRGEWAYHRTCLVCHGMNAVSASAIPDLRRSSAAADPETWKAVVIDGVLTDNGMVSFARNYSPDDAEAIRAYVVAQANKDLDVR